MLPYAAAFVPPDPAMPDGLASHVIACARSRGRGHGLRGLAEAFKARLPSRVMSTLAVLVLLTTGLVWWMG